MVTLLNKFAKVRKAQNSPVRVAFPGVAKSVCTPLIK